MYVCMYVRTYVHTYIHTYIHTLLFGVYTCMHTYIHTPACIHTLYVCMHAGVYMYTKQQCFSPRALPLSLSLTPQQSSWVLQYHHTVWLYHFQTACYSKVLRYLKSSPNYLIWVGERDSQKFAGSSHSNISKWSLKTKRHS